VGVLGERTREERTHPRVSLPWPPLLLCPFWCLLKVCFNFPFCRKIKKKAALSLDIFATGCVSNRSCAELIDDSNQKLEQFVSKAFKLSSF
jgi:hypothetical protein